MTVDHRVTRLLRGGYSHGKESQYAGLTSRWVDYLFRNPDLDPRVVRIKIADEINVVPIDLPIEDTINFLSYRNTPKCKPLAHVDLLRVNSLTRPHFLAFATNLGSNLRTLHVTDKIFSSFREIQSGIVILDQAVPLLRTFTLDISRKPGRFSFSPCTPLSGMLNLRAFNFKYSGKNTQDVVADPIYRIGGDDCIFLNVALGTIKPMEALNEQCQKLKLALRKS